MATSLLQNAIDLLDQGQPADAIRVLRPLTQRLPNYPSPFILLARAYEAEGNWKAATATWQHVNGLVAESPVVAAGMKRGRTRLAKATLRTATPAPASTAPTPSDPDPADSAAAAPPPRAWEWPEGLINEYADLRDPDAEAELVPSAMPDSPVVKKLLARLEDADPSPTLSSVPRTVETPADREPPPLEDTRQASDTAEAQDVADGPAQPTPGHAIAAELLDEMADEADGPEQPAPDTTDAPPDRAQELTALLDALDETEDAPATEAEALDGQTALPFDAESTSEPSAAPATTVPAAPEPEPDPIADLDAVFEFDPASAAQSPAAAVPTADDLAEGYDDLDALIESLEGARIRPRADLDDIPPPDLDDDIEDVVSETLARIYAGQRKYEEAARVYEKLAEQQPERATEFTEKAALVRGRSR
ncbi:MAG: tetratricopeptide repeat protein [Bacteroidota bacterium]